MDRAIFPIILLCAINTFLIFQLQQSQADFTTTVPLEQPGPSGPWFNLPGPARDSRRHEDFALEPLVDNLPKWFEAPGWPKDRSRNVEAYLKIGEESALIEPDRKVPDSSQPQLLILVQSAPGHTLRRQAIRQLWGYDCSSISSCQLSFVLGKLPPASNDSLQLLIEDEAAEFGDVLQEDFVEDYYNLTLKSLFSLKYLVGMDESFTHFLKVDDDCFVNLDPLRTDILADPSLTSSEFLLGFEWIGVRPKRDKTLLGSSKGRWLVPRYIYDKDVYPNFMGGPGYLMSREAAECVFRAAQATPIFFLEDVYITGLSAAKCTNITRISTSAFVVDDPFFGSGFDPTRDIVVHGANGDKMKALYKRLARYRREMELLS